MSLVYAIWTRATVRPIIDPNWRGVWTLQVSLVCDGQLSLVSRHWWLVLTFLKMVGGQMERLDTQQTIVRHTDVHGRPLYLCNIAIWHKIILTLGTDFTRNVKS